MHKPDSVLVNEISKILWDFEIQTNHRIPTRKLVLVSIKKKTCHLKDFTVPVNHRVKIKESEKIDK